MNPVCDQDNSDDGNERCTRKGSKERMSDHFSMDDKLIDHNFKNTNLKQACSGNCDKHTAHQPREVWQGCAYSNTNGYYSGEQDEKDQKQTIFQLWSYHESDSQWSDLSMGSRCVE